MEKGPQLSKARWGKRLDSLGHFFKKCPNTSGAALLCGLGTDSGQVCEYVSLSRLQLLLSMALSVCTCRSNSEEVDTEAFRPPRQCGLLCLCFFFKRNMAYDAQHEWTGHERHDVPHGQSQRCAGVERWHTLHQMFAQTLFLKGGLE